MHGGIGGGLSPGVTIGMIPGNRPEDVFAEQVVEATKDQLIRAKLRLDVPRWTTIDDLWGVLEEVEWELAGEDVTPDEIAKEVLRRYVDRRENEDGEEG